MLVLKSILFFILAGLCEVGGGYLIWLWLKENKPLWYGLAGCMIMLLYCIFATFQPSNFGRTYAAYGGVFIVLSLLWAWRFDDFKPDKFDIAGAIIAIAGVFIILYSPRK